MTSAVSGPISTSIPIDPARLYEVLPLAERAALGPSARPPLPPEALQRAEQLVQRWRNEAGLEDDAAFRARLQQESLTPEAFLDLLGAKGMPPTGDLPLARLDTLAACRAALAELSQPTRRPSPMFAGASPRAERRFLVLIEPLIRRAGLELIDHVRGIAANAALPLFDPASVDRLTIGSLFGGLTRLIHRTLILELNVARVEGRLEGESSEARFDSFVEWLGTPEAAATIFQEYPLLLGRMVKHIAQWKDFAGEILTHLSADWPDIQRTLGPAGDVGLLAEVSFGAGDAHRGGRTVTVLRFTSGWRIVYKPRSLAVDVHFMGLLEWLNARGAEPPFRTMKVLDKGSRGWQEFIAPSPCADEAAVERFYERQGAYLALLHTLEASDFHKENLIAAGEHPMPIDLETLFHPLVTAPVEDEPFATAVFQGSALRVGLLPMPSWSGDGLPRVDISGLGGAPGQWTPELPGVDEPGTDRMRIVHKAQQMWSASHRPQLEGRDVDVQDHVEPLVRGFQSMYRRIVALREPLMSPDGPLAAFDDDEIRVVLRSTRSYGFLLTEAQHPDLLRSALDRDRFFDRLWKETRHRGLLKRVVPHEQSDLRNGDVPMFVARPGSRHLWAGDGTILENFLTEPTTHAVRRRLGEMTEDDLARQCTFIRASIATLPNAGGGAHAAASHAEPAVGVASAVSADELLQTARAVGDRLEALAVRGRGEVSWIGLSLFGESWSLRPLDPYLYSGLSGVALFLGYLGHVTGEERYSDLSRAALGTVRRQLKPIADLGRPFPLGGFGGLGGAIYAMSHLGIVLRDETILSDAEALLAPALPGIDADNVLDLIGGSAGLLLGAASLAAVRRSDVALDVVRRCAQHLVDRAEPQAPGVAWSAAEKATRPLLGISHGASGMAMALAEAYRLTDRADLRALVRGALAYERARYSPEARNWPDYRILDERATSAEDSFVFAWCHGAPGIGLARVRLLQQLGHDAEVEQDLAAAAAGLRERGTGANHSLCHGDLGNCDLMIELRRRDDGWAAPLEHTAAAILESTRRIGWRCGLAGAVESPGLMAGLAGIGYGFLRLAAPDRVPSVLMLEAPRRSE